MGQGHSPHRAALRRQIPVPCLVPSRFSETGNLTPIQLPPGSPRRDPKPPPHPRTNSATYSHRLSSAPRGLPGWGQLGVAPSPALPLHAWGPEPGAFLLSWVLFQWPPQVDRLVMEGWPGAPLGATGGQERGTALSLDGPRARAMAQNHPRGHQSLVCAQPGVLVVAHGGVTVGCHCLFSPRRPDCPLPTPQEGNLPGARNTQVVDSLGLHRTLWMARPAPGNLAPG